MSRLGHLAPEYGLSPQSRAGLTYAVALIIGAVLFFLCFAAIFNGSRPLLLFFILCYVPLALALAGPAVPWVLWLFPASIPEAGLLRALLWPGIALILFGLAWIGGAVMTRISACHRGIAAVG